MLKLLYFLFFIQQVCVKWNRRQAWFMRGSLGGFCCLRCCNTDCPLALPQTDKTDFPKVRISRTRLAVGYQWTNWQSITVNDGGKENSWALVCSHFFFFMGQEKTRKHVYSWNPQERLAYNLLSAGFHMKMHSPDQRFWSGVTRARH